jgi:hypothetical protein
MLMVPRPDGLARGASGVVTRVSGKVRRSSAPLCWLIIHLFLANLNISIECSCGSVAGDRGEPIGDLAVAAMLIDQARHDPDFSHATRSTDEKTVGSMDSGGMGKTRQSSCDERPDLIRPAPLNRNGNSGRTTLFPYCSDEFPAGDAHPRTLQGFGEAVGLSRSDHSRVSSKITVRRTIDVEMHDQAYYVAIADDR